MTDTPRPRARRLIPLFFAAAILIAALVATLLFLNDDRDHILVQANPATDTPVSRMETPGTPGTPAGAPESVAMRPLPVATSSPTHDWTQGDAMELKVIERIAHNPDEIIKMVEENDRIKRRQLVYRNQTAAKLVQKSRLSGEPLKRFTLPGLDGQELQVEIVSADLAPSGQTGSFHGHLTGKPASMVTLAFEFGVEAFTVLSPDDGLYLQADPREPGELIVKSIDPVSYAPFHCGNPDHVTK